MSIEGIEGTETQTDRGHTVGHTGALSTVQTEGTDNQSDGPNSGALSTAHSEAIDNQSDREHTLAHCGSQLTVHTESTEYPLKHSHQYE